MGKTAVIKASQKDKEYKVEKLFDLFELFYVCCAIHGTVKLGYIMNNYIVYYLAKTCQTYGAPPRAPIFSKLAPS